MRHLFIICLLIFFFIFLGPIGEEEVRANLKMTNISDKNVQFKIKTTCPTSYCVKPTMGIIKPKNSANCIGEY